LEVAQRTFQEWKFSEVKQLHDGLERKANVYYASALEVRIPWTTEQKKRHRELNKLNRAHDDYLFTWAWAHFQKDDALRPRLIDIRRGHGSRDDAEDVVREVRIFRDNLPILENKTPVTAEYLDQAERDATEQLELLKIKDGGDQTGSPLDLRRRAYTAWEIDYNSLIHEGRYLTGDTPEAASLFPKVSAERSGSNETEPASTEPTTTPTEPTADGGDA
jgi:hypothetical protein